jgi:hypothetical protein
METAAQTLRNQTAFAEEISLAEYADYRFPPLLGSRGNLDLAPHDVEHGVGRVSLRENDLSGPALRQASAVVHGGKEHVRIKRGAFSFSCHIPILQSRVF